MSEQGKHSEVIGSLEERFRSVYIPAHAAQITIGYLSNNPFCSNLELKAATGVEFIKDDYPEILYLANGILATRESVRRVYKDLTDGAGSQKATVAEILYKSAIKPENHKPVERLEMSYLNNPFALVLTAHPQDFKFLDSRDVAGHYNSGLSVSINSSALGVVVPFIAINPDVGWTKDAIELHEQWHGKNAAVRNSLGAAKEKNLWETGTHYSLNPVKNLNTKWKALETNPKREAVIASDPNLASLMERCLADVKDEVVVRLATGESMLPVYKREGYYDPLKHMFDAQETPVIDLFWQKYCALVDRQTRFTRNVIDTYRFYGDTARARVIPWVLMRIPLEKWEQGLNSVGITGETDLLTKIGKQRSKDTNLRKILDDHESLHVHDLARYWQTLR